MVFSGTLFKGLRAKMSSYSSVDSYVNLPNQKSQKHCHPAAERNKGPILEILKKYIKPNDEGYFLEIASGSGQHVAHIAPNFPNITFQPSEFDESSINSIEIYASECLTRNIKLPVAIDVRSPSHRWMNGLVNDSVDYILCINLIHISEWISTRGLFRGSGNLLKPSGYLFTYGPYACDGHITPQSNVEFDKLLKMRDKAWGLRDIVRDLKPLAEENNLFLKSHHDMPANNKMLVWQKKNGTVVAEKEQ